MDSHFGNESRNVAQSTGCLLLKGTIPPCITSLLLEFASLRNKVKVLQAKEYNLRDQLALELTAHHIDYLSNKTNDDAQSSNISTGIIFSYTTNEIRQIVKGKCVLIQTKSALLKAFFSPQKFSLWRKMLRGYFYPHRTYEGQGLFSEMDPHENK